MGMELSEERKQVLLEQFRLVLEEELLTHEEMIEVLEILLNACKREQTLIEMFGLGDEDC